MRKCNQVTIVQALVLKKLGFTEPCVAYLWKSCDGTYHKELITESYATDWNSYHGDYLSIPTLDEAIDWVRRKYDLMIINRAHPFVSPITNKIKYCYMVKYCNIKRGWNGREYIGYSTYTHDIYSAKRQAITIALRWIIKNLSESRKSDHKY